MKPKEKTLLSIIFVFLLGVVLSSKFFNFPSSNIPYVTQSFSSKNDSPISNLFFKELFCADCDCSVAGFDWCYDHRRLEKHGKAYCRAYAQVFGTQVKGIKKGSYFIKEAYTEVGYDGLSLYMVLRPSSFNDITCNERGCTITCYEDGCSGGIITGGKVKLAETGQTVPCFIVASWDYAYNKVDGDECWAWVVQKAGYLCENYGDMKVVDCYDNSDCSENYFCDKSGDWYNWRCKRKECEPTSVKCDGLNFFTCEDYMWENHGMVVGECGVECDVGETKCEGKDYFTCDYITRKWVNLGKVPGNCAVECLIGEEYCDGNNLITCSNNYTYNFVGYVKGKCNVECLIDSDCPRDTLVGLNYCYNNDLVRTFRDYSCVRNNCTFKESKVLTVSCKELCKNGSCVSSRRQPNFEEKFVPASLVAIILLTLIILFSMWWRAGK